MEVRGFLAKMWVRCPLPSHLAGHEKERELVGLGEVCEWEMRWK